MSEKKVKTLSLEILTETTNLRKMSPKGQIVVPKRLRKEIGMKPDNYYLSISVTIKSGDPQYIGVRGILVFPVSLSYALEKYKAK